MTHSIYVLGGVCNLSKILKMPLQFEDSYKDIDYTSEYDLPNCIISSGSFDQHIKFNSKDLTIKTDLANYIAKQMRKSTDEDFFGLYSSIDTLEFKMTIPKNSILKIYYNVQRKNIKFEPSFSIHIIDNELTQRNNYSLIESLLEIPNKSATLYTANSSLDFSSKCDMEYLKI